MPSLKSKDVTELCKKIKINDDLILEKKETLKRMVISLDMLKKIKIRDKLEQIDLKEKQKHDWSKAKDEYLVLKEDFRKIVNENQKQKSKYNEIQKEIEKYNHYFDELKHYYDGLKEFIKKKKDDFANKKLTDTHIIKEKEKELMTKKLNVIEVKKEKIIEYKTSFEEINVDNDEKASIGIDETVLADIFEKSTNGRSISGTSYNAPESVGSKTNDITSNHSLLLNKNSYSNYTATSISSHSQTYLNFYSARPFNSSKSKPLHQSIQPTFIHQFEPVYNNELSKLDDDEIHFKNEINDSVEDNFKQNIKLETNHTLDKKKDDTSSEESNSEEEVEDFKERNILIFNTLLNRNFLVSNNNVRNKIDDETNIGFFQRSQDEIWTTARRRGSFEHAKKRSKTFRLSWSDINEGDKPQSGLNKPRDLTRKVSFDSVTLFYEACRDGDCHVLQRLIDEKDMTEEDLSIQANTTPMHICIFAGNMMALELLVSRGFDLNRLDLDGWSPLHSAATCNDVGMCQLLITHGACVLARSRDGGELASELCDELEAGCEETRQYLRSAERSIGLINNGLVYGVLPNYEEIENETFNTGEKILIYKSNDRLEVIEKSVIKKQCTEWWLCALGGVQGLVPCDCLAIYPRIQPTISC